MPLIGFAFCGMNRLAQIVGGIWFAIGIIYLAAKTNLFRSAPVMIDFRDS